MGLMLRPLRWVHDVKTGMSRWRGRIRHGDRATLDTQRQTVPTEGDYHAKLLASVAVMPAEPARIRGYPVSADAGPAAVFPPRASETERSGASVRGTYRTH